MTDIQIGLEAQVSLTPAQTAARRAFEHYRDTKLAKFPDATEQQLPRSYDFLPGWRQDYYLRLGDACVLHAHEPFEQIVDAVFRAAGGKCPVRKLQPHGRNIWRGYTAAMLDIPYEPEREDNDGAADRSTEEEGRAGRRGRPGNGRRQRRPAEPPIDGGFD